MNRPNNNRNFNWLKYKSYPVYLFIVTLLTFGPKDLRYIHTLPFFFLGHHILNILQIHG